jgi:hypothetical protein
MKKTMTIPLPCGLFILFFAAGFSGCVSSAQEKADALFPRHEQARIAGGGSLGIDVSTIDGEELSAISSAFLWELPGLAPGRHSVGFYFVRQGTATVAGPTTTSTLYSSGNLSVTKTTTSTQSHATIERASDLLTVENDFTAGRLYALANGADAKPLIYEAGYSDWYWQWRVESKKPEETLVTIEDEHYKFAQGPWPFILLIDGDPSLFFPAGQEYEIVLSQGRHTFAVIDKKDPLAGAVSASYELDIGSEEMEIEIGGSGKEFTLVDVAVEEKAADDAEAAVRKAVALSAKFPAAFNNAVGPGESILEVIVDYTFEPPVDPLEIFLDDEPIMRTGEKQTSMRFKIPNGPHTILARNTNKLVGQETSEEFTAKSNLISATLTQGLVFSDDIEIEEKPLK